MIVSVIHANFEIVEGGHALDTEIVTDILIYFVVLKPEILKYDDHQECLDEQENGEEDGPGGAEVLVPLGAQFAWVEYVDQLKCQVDLADVIEDPDGEEGSED